MNYTCDRCGADAPEGVSGPRDHRNLEECVHALRASVERLEGRLAAVLDRLEVVESVCEVNE